MKLEQMHSLSIDILNQLGQLKKMVEDNKIELSADWPDPSFIGQFLPNTKNVTKKHFQAQWKISSLASGFPSYFDMAEIKKEIYEEKHNTFYTSLGVRFLKTADHYQQAERTSACAAAAAYRLQTRAALGAAAPTPGHRARAEPRSG